MLQATAEYKQLKDKCPRLQQILRTNFFSNPQVLPFNLKISYLSSIMKRVKSWRIIRRRMPGASRVWESYYNCVWQRKLLQFHQRIEALLLFVDYSTFILLCWESEQVITPQQRKQNKKRFRRLSTVKETPDQVELRRFWILDELWKEPKEKKKSECGNNVWCKSGFVTEFVCHFVC